MRGAHYVAGAAAILLAGGAAPALAATAGSPLGSAQLPPGTRLGVPGQPSDRYDVLESTTVRYTPGGTSLIGGFTEVDRTTVYCPRTIGCVVGFADMVQVGAQSSTGNEWAICGTVDGNFINPPCPFQGAIPADGTYTVGNSLQNYPVSRGLHQVILYVYTTNTAVLANSEFHYLVYAP